MYIDKHYLDVYIWAKINDKGQEMPDNPTIISLRKNIQER